MPDQEPQIINLMDALKKSCDEARGSEDLAQWEKRCRAAHLSELGHLMFTAPTRYHAQIAERVAWQRLAEVPNPFAKKETPDA